MSWNNTVNESRWGDTPPPSGEHSTVVTIVTLGVFVVLLVLAVRWCRKRYNKHPKPTIQTTLMDAKEHLQTLQRLIETYQQEQHSKQQSEEQKQSEEHRKASAEIRNRDLARDRMSYAV